MKAHPSSTKEKTAVQRERGINNLSEGEFSGQNCDEDVMYGGEDAMNDDFVDKLGSSAPLEPEEFEPLQVMCEINGFIVPAVIDTGAQVSVMSLGCARRCHLTQNIDTRYAGRAVGVGSMDITGRIGSLPLRIGPMTCNTDLTILRQSGVDFIIGLDFLRRFKASINLHEQTMRIQVNGKGLKINLLRSRKSMEGPQCASSYFDNDAVEGELYVNDVDSENPSLDSSDDCFGESESESFGGARVSMEGV